MSDPLVPPLVPAQPDIDVAEWSSLTETLLSLHGRVPKLLFAAPHDAGSAAALTRLARQIDAYLDAAAKTLTTLKQEASADTAEPQRMAQVPAALSRLRHDVGCLDAELDAYLADPQTAARRTALGDTVARIIDPPFDHADGAPTPTPSAGPTAYHTGEPSRFALRRLDAVERDGWHRQLARMQRRATLAIVLAGLALAGIAANLLQTGGILPAPVTQRGPQPLWMSAWENMRPTNQASGELGENPTAQPRPWTTEDTQTLLQVPERLAKLEIEVLHLDARLDALESYQVAVDRARQPESDATPDRRARETAQTRAAATTPAVPPQEPQTPSADRPSYGIQVATLKSRGDIPKFIRESGLNPKRLYGESRGSRVVVIEGLYADRDQAKQALDGLSGPLRKRGPLLRAFAPGAQPLPIELP